MIEFIKFIAHLLRPRAIKWCFRMSEFDRAMYSMDYLKLRCMGKQK